MTNAEAIEILRDMGGCCSSDNEYIACNMAISALEKAEEEEEEDPALYEFEPGRFYWNEMAANP